MTKVLLVEDDNNLREIYEARLAAEGYEISTAKDGEDALAVAKQVKPDLIISDVMMPRISGFEMLDILRNTDGLKHTKIIMLTALGQAEDKGRADSLGADRYLVKSQVTLEDIVKAADELLNPDASPAENTTQASAPDVAETPVANTFSPIASPDVAAAAHQSQTVTTPAPISAGGTSESNDSPEATTTPVADIAVQPAPVDPAPIAQAAPSPAPAGNDSVIAATTPAPSNNATPVDPAPAAVSPAPAAADPSQPDDEPLIQMPPQPVNTEAAVATTAQVQSTSQENAAVTEQIENFVSAAPSTTPVAQPETSATPAEQPAVASETAAPEDTNNDSVIKAAMDDLASEASPSVSQPATPDSTPPAEPVAETNPAPAAPAEEPSVAQIPGKKVITPINNPSADKNDLQTLLAQEEMKENLAQGVTGTPVVGDTTTPPQQPIPDNNPAPNPPPTPEAAQTPPPGGVFMPNENGSANENAL